MKQIGALLMIAAIFICLNQGEWVAVILIVLAIFFLSQPNR